MNIDQNYAKAMYDEAAMDAGSGPDYSAGTTQVQAVVTVCYQTETAGS